MLVNENFLVLLVEKMQIFLKDDDKFEKCILLARLLIRNKGFDFLTWE